MNASSSNRSGALRRSAISNLVLVAVVGLYSAASSAAVTTGRIHGKAPAGVTVLAKSNDFATQRTASVNAKGRYLIHSLPVGVYTVSVIANGQHLGKHPSVPVLVDTGSRVDFECVQEQCVDIAED